MFEDYLIQIGLIPRKHILGQNVIFSLSDYLKNLSTSDAYDMSVRIYDNWKNGSTKQQKLKGLQKLQEIQTKWAFKRIKQQRQKIVIKQKNQSPSPPKKDYYLKQGLSETCERLYQDGLALKVKREQITQDRVKDELKACTFKPQVTLQVSTPDTKVFDRLYKTQLIGKFDYSDYKEQAEMKSCTFTPNIYTKEITQPSPAIFDRLYKEHEVRSAIKESFTPIRERNEMLGCTFKPCISEKAQNARRNESSENYIKSLQKNYKQMHFKRMERENEEINKCTFKPSINHTSSSPNSLPAFERLYQQRRNTPQQETSVKKKNFQQQSSRQSDQETLYERMKKYVNDRKRKIDQMKKDIDSQCTFQPRINQRLQSNQAENRSISMKRNLSSQSTKSDRKHSKNTISTFIFNTRKSQQDCEKENSLSMYCETAYFNNEDKNSRQKRSN
ncbi:hypothetical protein pb186bvf_001411 [Paramecium bursaria]